MPMQEIRGETVRFWVIALVIFCAMLGGMGQIFMKQGMDKFAIKTLLTNYVLIGGVGLYGIAFVLYLFALKFEHVSLLYPFISLSYIIVMVLSGWILKEPISTQMYLGAIAIVGGVSLIATGSH
ncbi:MAG: EamA family transporter [Candidatus Aenigmarchaeota archaeon]|nr:EamA family transporter [Candidatus Aenigmarchaeota archaeon]